MCRWVDLQLKHSNIHLSVLMEVKTFHPPPPPPLCAAELAQCYRIVTDVRGCELALPTQITKDMCCCTVGKAWGRNCERCPQEGTGEDTMLVAYQMQYYYHDNLRQSWRHLFIPRVGNPKY